MSRTHTSAVGRLKTKAKALAVLGAASFALIAVAPASALDDNLDPWGRPMCSVKLSNGTTHWYREGETQQTTGADGVTRKYRCRNGKWVEEAALLGTFRLIYDGALTLWIYSE